MAAVALDVSYPYAGNPAGDAGWRDFMRFYPGSGVIAGILNELQVVTDTGRAVGLHTGAIWAGGQFGKLTSAVTGIAVAPNASGNPRIDRLVIRNNYTDKQVEFEVKTGTPASSPAPPALVSNSSLQEFSLAQIGPLASGFPNIASDKIVDERAFISPYADAAFASQAARDLWVPSPKIGFVAAVRASGGFYRWNGSAWQQTLRVVAHVDYQPSGDDATDTNATWPLGNTVDVDVPEWVTRMSAIAKIGQVHDLGATANVDVQLLLGTIVVDEQRIRWATGVDANSERDIVLMKDVDVSSVAGSTVTLRTLGNNVSGTGKLHADSESSSSIIAEFR